MPIRKAVVLAAGVGSRLGHSSRDLPKPLVPVAGRPMLERALENLADVGVEMVVIVVGHLSEVIISTIGRSFRGMRIIYVTSDRYRTTNNLYSLWLAREHLDADVYLLEADIVFESDLLGALADGPENNLAAVAPYRAGMSGTVVELDPNGLVTRLIAGKEQGTDFDATPFYKTVNVYVFRKEFLAEEFVPSLERSVEADRVHDFYELLLQETVKRGRHLLRGVDCAGFRWREVDDADDRLAADYLFGSEEERFAILERQHGGYGQLGVTDHSLLYNVYFPPPSMRRELTSEFDRALTQYPVGQETLATLLSGAIEQDPRQIVVANGLSELIKTLGRCIEGPAILAVPGFNEYERVFEQRDLIRVDLPRPSFELDVDAFALAAAEANARVAIVTSPNNPTSLAVSRDDLLRLSEHLERQDCLLAVDESFVDFCGDPAAQTLESDVGAHPNLVILKSLSKSCGIAGIRLGYLLAGDPELVRRVRGELPIWNVNGFAEAFLRLLPRYMGALAETCARVRADRDALAASLREIPNLFVYEPAANFVFVRLPDGWTGPEVVRHLFARHNILLKDCAGKSMSDGDRYVRIASRTATENRRVVEALAELLSAPFAPIKELDGERPADHARRLEIDTLREVGR